MLISSKGRYALRLMIYIAHANMHDDSVALRHVSAAENISLKYLEQLAHSLVKEGLLCSVRGKGGGYKLAKDPREVTAGDILRAAEGNTVPVACEGLTDGCPREGICTTVEFWQGLDDAIETYVDGVTLAQLALPQADEDGQCNGLFAFSL